MQSDVPAQQLRHDSPPRQKYAGVTTLPRGVDERAKPGGSDRAPSYALSPLLHFRWRAE